MSVVDAKEGALWPLIYFSLLWFWLHDVQDYRYPVFIVVPINFQTKQVLPDDALVRISSVSGDNSVPFVWVLCRLVVCQDETILLYAWEFIPQTLEELSLPGRSTDIVVPALTVLVSFIQTGVSSGFRGIVSLQTEVRWRVLTFMAVIEVSWVPRFAQEITSIPRDLLLMSCSERSKTIVWRLNSLIGLNPTTVMNLTKRPVFVLNHRSIQVLPAKPWHSSSGLNGIMGSFLRSELLESFDVWWIRSLFALFCVQRVKPYHISFIRLATLACLYLLTLPWRKTRLVLVTTWSHHRR